MLPAQGTFYPVLQPVRMPALTGLTDSGLQPPPLIFFEFSKTGGEVFPIHGIYRIQVFFPTPEPEKSSEKSVPVFNFTRVFHFFMPAFWGSKIIFHFLADFLVYE